MAVALVLVAGAAAGLLTDPPPRLPAAALGSPLLLRLEVGAAAALVALLAAALVVRGLLDGELPRRFGREGFEWPVAEDLTAELERLENQQRLARRAIAEIGEALADTQRQVAAITRWIDVHGGGRT
ncbi:MAG TPA: hypothetical protein VNT51_06750 [Miltoncostaeaceae bacterium]|nr:hypothetical protein [Miltoncostaeaceae bacterium]